MKKLFTILAVAAAMVSCAKEDVVSVSRDAAIAFDGIFVENATRANDPSTTADNINEFYVWAVIDNETGIVFDDEKVWKSGDSWTYNETQQWVPGHKYYFSAIAGDRSNDQIVLDLAAGNGMSLYGLGTATFTNEDGTNDFLYAEYKVKTPEAFTTTPDAVKFQFNHLLSKVKFTFENAFANENNTIVISDVTMTAPKIATIDLTADTYEWTGHKEGEEVTLDMGDVAGRVAAGSSASTDNERLTIPAGATQEYTVTFNIQQWQGEVKATEATKTIKISGVELLPGRGYNFKATINEQNVADNPLYDIEFEVECVNDWNHTDVDSAEAFANALKAETSSIHVTLTQDIYVPISSLGTITGGSGEYKLGGEGTEAITIDLNGHKLNITTTYWSNLGAKNNDAVFTIKNGTMTSSQPTGTWNSYDLTFSNCNYVIEDVDFEKAIAFANTGKSVSLKDVTIKETHDYYAMWICAEGMNVTVDNLTVESAGRGIKIDEQYVDAPAKVTLNVKNSKFTTAKKAAVVVKSAAGAEINVENIDITGVAEDGTFAVWVDEDAAAYADLVVVNGALVKVEGAKDTVASSATELAEAVQNGAKNVYLENGTYTLASYPAGLKLVGCGDNVVFDATGKKYGVHGDVTIENVEVRFANDNYTGFQHTNVEVYKNCTIVGQPFLYGNDVTFEGCTFEQTSADAYNVWTYGAKAVKFVDCVFNCAGKSVLIYTESGDGQDVVFEGCTLNASAPVDGKAAIEIDSSLIKGAYNVVINDTTATGFANGSVSGNSLWNNKKGNKTTITVDGVKVL